MIYEGFQESTSTEKKESTKMREKWEKVICLICLNSVDRNGFPLAAYNFYAIIAIRHNLCKKQRNKVKKKCLKPLKMKP